MSTVVTIEEAQARLKDLIANLAPGDELVITDNNRPVAEVRVPAPNPVQRVPGKCAGMLISYIDDDEHLADFKEYME